MRLFSTLFFLFALSILNAQVCVPDTTQIPPTSFIYPLPYQDTVPGSGIHNKACINTYYEQVFHVKVPSEVVFLGFPVHIKNIKLNSIDGLPAGLSYACEPDGCSMDANTIGCMKIYGTPDASNEVKIYPIALNFTFSTVELPPLDLSFPSDNIAPGKYEIEVKAEGSPDCVAAIHTIPGLIHRVYYNNNSGILVADLESIGQMDARLSVFSSSGNPVKSEKFKIDNGKSHHEFAMNNIQPGVYFYQITSGNKSIAGKVIIF
ncbi:MAG: T9SS type A sorting domain-containing protein [Saprospiraceae bacterium]|nr:T9SS type A sorting domain-containing protein [Saprospiraceae bacterium]